MRVNSLQLSDDGSNAIRLHYPAVALAAQGFDIHEVSSGMEVDDADVWVINRPATSRIYEVVCELIDSGHKVIVDVDDRFDCLRPGHVMFDKALEWDKWVDLSCQVATLVTCTTEGIANHYGHGKAVVIPNYVPESYLSVVRQPHEDPLRVGWSGTIATHVNDLQVTGRGVGRALRECKADFALIGPQDQLPAVKKALGVKTRALKSGWFGRDAYPHALGQLDVGIVPLEDCTFNNSKSWLKLLEMVSAGVPTVASPIDDNQLLLKAGIGLCAAGPKGWYQQVKSLLGSDSYRLDITNRSREIAAEYTIEKNSEQWVDAFLRTMAD